MKRIILLLCLILFSKAGFMFAGSFTVDTIFYNGDPNNYINFVVVGDGFTENEQDIFYNKATELINGIFQQDALANYKSYFNAFAIKVISEESGVSHPRTATTDPDCTNSSLPQQTKITYFGCTFDYYGIHRLLVTDSLVKVFTTVAAHIPQYDHVFLLSNTTEYGGSGTNNLATSSINSLAFEIVRHEMGHSFANLADEYWAGDSFAEELANMTKDNNSETNRWRKWIGTDGVGIYPFSENNTWFRPHQNCKMRSLGANYCDVCRQAIVKSIIDKRTTIVAAYPENSTVESTGEPIRFELTELLTPNPNTLDIVWKLNNGVIANAVGQTYCDLGPFAAGTHTIQASVTDTTDFLRLNETETRRVRTKAWAVNVTTDIKIVSNQESASFTVFPTTTDSRFTITIENDRRALLTAELFDLGGKLVKQLISKVESDGYYSDSFDISSVPSGIYILKMQSGLSSYSQKIIKK